MKEKSIRRLDEGCNRIENMALMNILQVILVAPPLPRRKELVQRTPSSKWGPKDSRGCTTSTYITSS